MKLDIGEMILVVFFDLISLSLTGTVAQAVTDAIDNVTGASAVLLPLVTVLYVGLIIGANIAVLRSMFTASA